MVVLDQREEDCLQNLYLHVSDPVDLGVLDILYHKYVDEELYHKQAYCRHPAVAWAEYQFVQECVVESFEQRREISRGRGLASWRAPGLTLPPGRSHDLKTETV